MRVGIIGLAGLAVIAAMPARAQDACGPYPVPQPSYSCTCPPGSGAAEAWGSGPYTADSDLCTAAVHAGAIGPQGGQVTARLAEGQTNYPASTANGVTMQRWGRYDSSFDFDTAAAPIQVEAPAPSAPPAPALPAAAANGAEQVCAGLDYSSPETVCRCEPGQGTGATLWGSSPYVAGSDLCAAARHAGVIGLDGGVISVIRVPGLTSYRGSERNGIKSADWDEYNESFVVNAN